MLELFEIFCELYNAYKLFDKDLFYDEYLAFVSHNQELLRKLVTLTKDKCSAYKKEHFPYE